MRTHPKEVVEALPAIQPLDVSAGSRLSRHCRLSLRYEVDRQLIRSVKLGCLISVVVIGTTFTFFSFYGHVFVGGVDDFGSVRFYFYILTESSGAVLDFLGIPILLAQFINIIAHASHG